MEEKINEQVKKQNSQHQSTVEQPPKKHPVFQSVAEQKAKRKLTPKTVIVMILSLPVIIFVGFLVIQIILQANTYFLDVVELDDGTYEFVAIESASLGTKSTVLEIPAEYDGKTISSVNVKKDHPHFHKKITVIKIAEGIESVVLNFQSHDFSSLERIELPSTLQTLIHEGDNTTDIEISFAGNSKFTFENNCLIEKATNKLVMVGKGYVLPDTVNIIGEYALSYCSFDEFPFDCNIELIAKGAFDHANIEKLKIDANVKRVEASFYKAEIQELHIASNITVFDPDAFVNAKVNTLVYDIMPTTDPKGELMRFSGIQWYYSGFAGDKFTGGLEVESDREGYRKFNANP